jgi:hypothetical protein
MKLLLVSILALLAFFRAPAQVSVELVLDQDQFLPSESVPVAVKITNRSGERVHFGADADWLTFSVESVDGFVVVKHAEVPVAAEFDLESSQSGTQVVDLQQYFAMSRSGRYRVTATLRLRAWTALVTSAAKEFDVINGARLWEQQFGVPTDAGGPPQMRKYVLEEANYLKSQLRLYVRVSDAAESQVIKVSAIGPMVSFSEPEEQVDRMSYLHVLYQSGAQMFTYARIAPDGEVAQRETYDYFTTRPRLVVNDSGEVAVVGGVRRMKPGELPVAPLPSKTMPAPAKP